MSLKELQNYTYYSKYARYIPEKNRRETWKESVNRVKQMMLTRYEKYPDVHNDIEFAYDFLVKQKVLGSQRILQFGGEPIFKHNARAFNCCFSYIDRLSFFQECMYLLLCGCGTGFSVQKCHINKLPPFSPKSRVNLPEKIYQIEDSIEGWSNSIGVLVSSYFENSPFPEYANTKVTFDTSLIRPAGAYLSSCSGKAPGPEPLIKALEDIRIILDKASKNKYLKPIEAYDIVMHSSDAVLSGGVRRSSAICLFSLDDEEMLKAKTGDWYYSNPQRGRSNNSVVLIKNKVKYEDFEKIVQSIKEFGEPGFALQEHEDIGWNPCFEACFLPIYEGKSGWQFCNLCSINGKKIKTKEQFIEFARAAAIIGTLQAGFTSFPYLGSISEEITKREALLGVSITGMMENPDILLNADFQKEAALEIRKTNEIIAKKININPSARLTNLKPEGTTSCFLGTSSGIHAHHSRRYFRTVQANNLESIFQYFKTQNPIACEKGEWSNNSNDSIIRFCIEADKSTKLKNELSAIQMLELVKLTQSNWVEYGTVRERMTHPGLKHNVSNTVQVKPNEWEEVTRFIYDNKKHFAGISLIPHSGDKDYIQAPFCSVYTPSEMVKEYGDASVFASGIIELCLSTFSNLWFACDAILGLKEIENNEQKVCVEKMQKFAERYFNKDIKKMTYCLKDVFNWKLWCDLNREYKEVVYEDLVEDEDFTNPIQEIACAGGKCEI